jgi:aminoglycoside phosphotransferase (APT) family kinase protein
VSDTLRDEPRSVRGEDAFDVEAVHAWLADRVDDLGGSPPEVRQFSGGASNLPYLLRYPDRDLILRRPPAGEKAASAHDMRREHRVQSLLKPVYPCVPEMIAFCDDPAFIGSEFYVMERLEGIILRADLPPGLDLTEPQVRELCTSVVDGLIDLHAIDPEEAGLTGLGRGEGYVERQISGWSKRYRAARTWNVPRFEKVMAWLEANRPADVASRVIHNDYRFDNVVLDPDDPTRIVGVLDWEMATLGDPLMDLGASLAYWVQADDDRVFAAFRRQPTHVPGMLTRAEVVDRYLERTGFSIGDWRFYEVYGLFRLAVIVQQIYRRYARRETRNPAFRFFWVAVHLLDRRCIIRRGRA